MTRPAARPEDAAILRARAVALARPPGARVEDGEPVVVLRMGDSAVAARLASLAGIANLGPVVPVPGAPSWLSGLTAIQGRPTCVIDPAVVLGLPPAPHSVAVLVAQAGGLVAFAASQAEMLRLPAAPAPLPAGLAPALARFAEGLLPDGTPLVDLRAVTASLDPDNKE